MQCMHVLVEMKITACVNPHAGVLYPAIACLQMKKSWGQIILGDKTKKVAISGILDFLP